VRPLPHELAQAATKRLVGKRVASDFFSNAVDSHADRPDERLPDTLVDDFLEEGLAHEPTLTHDGTRFARARPRRRSILRATGDG
jgi:hypothetical protein